MLALLNSMLIQALTLLLVGGLVVASFFVYASLVTGSLRFNGNPFAVCCGLA